MLMNPYVMAFFFYLMVTAAIYICVKLNYISIKKNGSVSKDYTKKSQPTYNKNSEIYHVGGMTSEHFILSLLETYSLDYGSYNYEDLYNKRTQTDYGAYDLFDVLWMLFGTFDEILDCEYVHDGYGVYYYKELEVRYDAHKDDMKIEIADMTIRGTLGEMYAFRNNPLQNFTMLDPMTASHRIEDYTGDIDY